MRKTINLDTSECQLRTYKNNRHQVNFNQNVKFIYPEIVEMQSNTI